MSWIRRLREQSLRTKLIITAIGAAVLVLGVASWLTLGYWRQESEAAASQQALLAAASVRSSVESGLTSGQPSQARAALLELVELESITTARVFGTNGEIVVSTVRSEEGTRPGVWIPSPLELPPGGTARPREGGEGVVAFLPLRAGGAAVLQVDFSLVPLEEALDRAARLGMLLLVGSLIAVVLITGTMLEREVVGPVKQVVSILGPSGSRRGADELHRIEESVTNLIRKEQAAEERLATQAGLAEVGEMAAEMAHEFKRPLASIRSAVGLLEQEYELNDQAQRLLSAVDGQLGKLTETMQDLFALAKPVELESEQVKLADVVDDALGQLAGLMDTSGHTVRRQYAPDTPPVSGDRHRLGQAALNLALNALESMDGGGTLTITLRPSDARDTVILQFQDTGPGIPADKVEKVIRPFYSTKPTGTGLGLPLVARVVAAHHGRLDIESQTGQGTLVRMVFPAYGANEPVGAS